jgi:hypothetical protein
MRRVSLSLAAISLFGVSASLYGGVLLSENFDELTPSIGATSAGAFSTINGTNVDIVGGGLFGDLCASPESGNCVNMNGSGGSSAGRLQSNMLFAPGNYLLSFDLIGNQGGVGSGTTEVTFGNYDQEFDLSSGEDTGGIVVNQSVTLNSPGYLLFAAVQGGDTTNLLDNVVVSTQSASGVPEPSSLLLIASALSAGMVAVLHRR